MGLAEHYSNMSSCERNKVGCVFVFGRRVISGGYNESPSGLPHCQGEKVCNSSGLGCQTTIHAEENAIINAARNGVSLMGSSAYCSLLPCPKCFGKMVNAGVEEIVFKHEYRINEAKQMAERLGIKLRKIEP